ncbi:MAG: leucine-rich repeat protein, partial [Lachnospiraceae bacterium]|nr:leucine-rich repeat protein [Lachnospiraceae bacterium]
EAGGRILHAGNTGDIRSEISADRYAADSAANPNPYIGGIAGKGNSLTIENSYTAGNIGDLTADALNAEGKFLNVFSTTGAVVTVKHLYFLASATKRYGEEVIGAGIEDFQQGNVTAELCSYQTEDGRSSGRTYWRQKLGTEDYPGSYHSGSAYDGKIIFVQFDLAANIGRVGADDSYSNLGELVNYDTKFSDLSFYQSVALRLSPGSKIFKKEGSLYREVNADTKIKKDVVFYVWENDGTSSGYAPELLPADEDPEASEEPETSEDPWAADASGSPDASESPSASPEVSSTPKPGSSGSSWWFPGVPSADVTTSSAPAESDVPAESATPAESGSPAESAAPEESAAPAESSAPAEPAAPVESGAPAESSAPAESAAPAESGAPSESAAPVEDLKDTDSLEKGEKIESNGVVFKASGTNSVVMEKNTNQDIKKATIPDTVKVGGVKYKVTSISAGAYAGCKKLKTVELGKNVKTIGKGCFKNCTNLKTVSFPKNLKTVSEGAFQNCKKLKSAALPATTKKIGKACFKNCKGMTKFSIGNVTKTKKGGLQLGENENVMAGGTPIAISIAASALENCTSLKQVIINSQVQKIGNAAFKQCKALSKIIVYSLILKKVGKQALMGVHNCKISVPTKKVKPYKVLFKNKGQGKKVVVAKM